jgi:hypothetical protein
VLDFVVAAPPDGPVQDADEQVAQVGDATHGRERFEGKPEEMPAQT